MRDILIYSMILGSFFLGAQFMRVPDASTFTRAGAMLALGTPLGDDIDRQPRPLITSRLGLYRAFPLWRIVRLIGCPSLVAMTLPTQLTTA